MRYEQMLQVGQNLTSVINSPHHYDTQFTIPPLPPPPPRLAASAASEGGRDAMRRYKKIMGPYATTYHKYASSNPKAHGAKKAEQEEQAQQELEHCLTTVPEDYFRPDFSVKDKKFFSKLSERKDKMVLQDKLSYYLDLVEVNLLKQICLRSSSVFAALQTIQKLHSDVAAACRQIKSIRENIKRLHDHLVLSVANVLRKKRRNVNIAVLKEKLELLANVVGAQPTVQVLLSTADFANALNLISSTKKILRNDLAGVACIKNIEQKLDQQAILIEKLVTTDFTQLALGNKDSEFVRENIPTKLSDEVSMQMAHLAANALKMGKLTQLVTSFGTAVHKFVKQFIRDILEKHLDKMEEESKLEENKDGAVPKHISGDTKSREWKSRMKNLEHSQYVQILNVFFPRMIKIVRRLAIIEPIVSMSSSVLARREDGLSDKTNAEDLQAEAKAALTQYRNLLSSTCEFIHGRASQILLTRKSNYKSMRLKELTDVFDITNKFIGESEELCKKQFYGLKGTLKDQTKKFLEVFHSKNLNELNACLEGEQWKQAEVPREFQDLIDSGFRRKLQSVIRSEGGESKISRVIFFAVRNKNGAHSGFLKFALVSSTLILLKMISRYIECASQLKVIGSEILNKLILLLQLFNSKSCGLVLGAAAIQTAGLKNINVTHLALASQSLGLVISQIPVIRAALIKHIPPKHQMLLDNFNNVKGDYAQHQREIFNKLVQIILQLTENAMKKIVDSDWARGQTPPNVKVEKNIKVLMGQTASMHNKLSRLIDQQQRDDIFRRIADVFSKTSQKYFSTLFKNGNDPIKRKISAQIQHILSRLRGLTGLDKETCKDLEALVMS